LIFASQQGWEDGVHLLLAAGANLNAKDSSGHTALEYAMQNLSRSPGTARALVDARGASQSEPGGGLSAVSGPSQQDRQLEEDRRRIASAQALTRTSDAQFVWPAWLPEYPGWYDGDYISGVVFVKSPPGWIEYYLTTVREDEYAGGFRFKVALTSGQGPQPNTAAGWNKLADDIRDQVYSFYLQKCQALGMTAKIEMEQRFGPQKVPTRLVAGDGQRGLTVRQNGTGSGFVPFDVFYAPCAGVDTKGEFATSAVDSGTLPPSANEIPCRVPK
jgi:hypothetical protein